MNKHICKAWYSNVVTGFHRLYRAMVNTDIKGREIRVSDYSPRRFRLGLFIVLFSPFITAYAADVVITNSGGTLDATSLSGHDLGQSFTATKTGVLSSIEVAEDGGAVAGTATLNIYDGSGTGGTVLYTKAGIDFSVVDTVTTAASYTLYSISIDSTVNITSGNVYTFVFTPGTAFDMAYFTSDGYAGGVMYSADNGGFQAGTDMAFQLTQGDGDVTAPTISAVSIANSDHKVGDTVTATITVTSDADDYTTGSGAITGTINGYTLGSLSKTNDTTYTASFTITDGGTDVAAGTNVAINFTLDDSSGNTSAAFTTAISQASDAIYANLPDVSLSADTNSIAEDGGVSTLTATLSGSLNSQWPAGITVNLAYTGTGTAGADYSKSDSIVISAGNSSNTATVTGTADTLFDAAAAETAIVDISSVSVGNENGVQQETITITDAEVAPTVTLSVDNASVAENGGTSTITATLNHQTYDSAVVNISYSGTATGGGTDYNTPSSSITINAGSLTANAVTGITAVNDGSSDGNLTIVIDVDSVTGSASESGTQQQTVTIIDDEDGLAPTISAVSIADSVHKVGDTVTATITVTSDADDYTTGSGAITGSINGYALGSLSKTNNTTYTANFSVTDGGTDVAAGTNVAVSFTLTDSSGNISAAFTTAISQASDAIYANVPDVDLTADTNTIAEDGGVSTLTATLSGSLNNQWPVGITVNLAYTGTGTAGTDYAKSDSIVISAGNSTNTATITGTADTIFDAAVNETAIVDINTLSVGNEGTTNQQTITITDAEVAPVVTLSTGASAVVENGGTSAITATLNNPTYANVTVNLGYTGTATRGGVDYNTPSASITIVAGASSASAATGITGVDDGGTEGSETIIIDITSVAGGSASESGTQQKTVILGDDETIPVVTLSASAATITETAGTSTLTATLDQADFQDVTVNLTYSGTATSGTDYATPAASITITAGQTTNTTVLTATNDSSDESNETIIVDISSVSGGFSIESGSQQETITITNVDATPAPTPDPVPVTASVSLSASPASIEENAGSSTITASLSQVVSGTVTVNLGYSGTASSGSDYQASLSSISIAAGQTSGSASLTSVPDNIIEGNEFAIVSITGVTGNASESGSEQQTITIVDEVSELITSADSAILEEEGSASIAVLANDSGYVLNSLLVKTAAGHGLATVNTTNGAITYTPQADFNGSDSFTYTVNDGQGNVSADTLVTITVTAINDAPVAENDSISRDNWLIFNLDVLANDTDVDGDSLQIIGATVDNGSLSFSDSAISYTPVEGFVGTVVIDYHISDNFGGQDTAQVLIDINVSNADLPVINVPADITTNAVALSTKVDLGVATAEDRDGNPLPVSIDGDSTFFQPGVNTVFWRATDSEGKTAVSSQTINVNPLISLEKDQTVIEGYSVTFGIHLNGISPTYPLTIPYTVGGTAQAGIDHDLVAGNVTLASGTDVGLSFNVFADDLTEGEETITIELGSELNRGSKFSQVITISEEAIAPKVSLQVEQAGEERFIANLADGLVVVSATVTHPDVSKLYSYAWSNSEQVLTDADSSEVSFSFEPASLALGIYHLQLTVTTLDENQLSADEQVTIRLEQEIIVLGDEDTDNDGIPDNVEGLGDGDSDGIPDYLDSIAECNVLPERVSSSENFLLEGDPGVCLRLGDVALGDASGGTRITEDESSDTEVVNVGGIFDFIAYGLPEAGQEYRIVLPQIQPIPAGGVYRKQGLSGQWSNFVQNGENQLWSSAGESGYCPPPGDPSWQTGLNEGDWCVQLVMSDGGPNDADGDANNAIVDPGGVAVLRNSNNHQPIAVDDNVDINLNSSLSIDVLANDSDEDGDSLVITSANANVGSVVIENNQLFYQAADNYFGVDTIIYGITDNQGGSSSGTLLITVLAKENPLAVSDNAYALLGEVIIIDVLSNDEDENNEVLTLISATAEHGSVTVNDDNKLVYTASESVIGSDRINYLIRNVSGEESSGIVNVLVVEKNEPSVIKKTKKGGAVFMLLLACLALLSWRGKKRY